PGAPARGPTDRAEIATGWLLGRDYSVMARAWLTAWDSFGGDSFCDRAVPGTWNVEADQLPRSNPAQWLYLPEGGDEEGRDYQPAREWMGIATSPGVAAFRAD